MFYYNYIYDRYDMNMLRHMLHFRRTLKNFKCLTLSPVSMQITE